jgi:hypothetical protein
MAPGIRLREWRVAEMRRQELLEQAAQRQRLVDSRRDEAAPRRSVRLWAAVRALQAELRQGVENANLELERPQPGPRGFRDGLR